MACAVYCLIPRLDQLDPLVDRLRAAGVSPRDISVVLRERPPPAADPLMQAWWPLLWPLAIYDWAASSGVRRPDAHADGKRVISLAQYRARTGA